MKHKNIERIDAMTNQGMALAALAMIEVAEGKREAVIARMIRYDPDPEHREQNEAWFGRIAKTFDITWRYEHDVEPWPGAMAWVEFLRPQLAEGAEA